MKTTQQKALLILRTLCVCFVALISFGCLGTSRIQIDAAANFPDMGGVRRPLVAHTMWLLRESVTSPEMEEAFKKYMTPTTPPVKPGTPLPENELRTRAEFMMGDGKQIWNKYIVDNVETNFKGKAMFRYVAPGEYWVYCMIKRPSGPYVIWNVKTTVPFFGTANVTINNQNILVEQDKPDSTQSGQSHGSL